MRVVMVSEAVGDAYGQERVTRDSTQLLRQAGVEVAYLAARVKPGAATVDALCQMEDLFSTASSSQVVTQLKALKADLVHFVDVCPAAVTQAICKNYPTLATAHTVALTCPASGRVIYPAGACTQKSGWGCLWHHQQYQCLRSFRTPLHRMHVVAVYRRKRRALRHLRLVTAISRFVERVLLEDGWPREKVLWVPNPVPVSFSQRTLEVPHPLILCAARLVAMKGIGVLIEALRELQPYPWHLWILGEGPERARLEALSQAYGLRERVRFLGEVSFDECQSFIASCDLLVQPNIGPEGFGLSVAEACAQAKPVIASAVGALSELVENGRSGLLVPPQDKAALREALASVLTNPAYAVRLGEQAKKKMEKEFSPLRHVEALVAAYQTCLGQRSKAKAA